MKKSKSKMEEVKTGNGENGTISLELNAQSELILKAYNIVIQEIYRK